MRTILINCGMAGVALGAVVVPGAAHASSTSDTGVAVLGVIDQCTVSGGNVDLGAYLATQSWSDVADDLGFYDGVYTPGARGAEYLNFGSVTCAAGAAYTLSINGSGAQGNGMVMIAINGKTMAFYNAVKRIGDTVLGDGGFGAGFGAGFAAGLGQVMVDNRTVSGVGTGAPQALIGSVTAGLTTSATTAGLAERLAAPGTYSDALTYTLNF